MLDVSRLTFRKSSYSSATQENCVEVAEAPGAFAVRDSQHPDAGVLSFPVAEWRAFLDKVKRDHL
ncbi:DUF397 domain-containing protein [Halostreptopolyspora alba]|uniref:DUF397 domain-containing protein n=1 Tax=Halostreptopolyspora alba TaxID=2487137 RepID=A0A3N0E8K4_9ACTN|nr:DUF397 domain-containing protein [Nocardiopsaceae bacterium YIM 96095]